MTETSTQIPIPPDIFWPLSGILALGLAGLVAYAVISASSSSYRSPPWEKWSPLALSLAAAFALLWGGLLALTIVSAYSGAWEILHPDEIRTGPLGGFGIGALLAALLGAPFVIWGTYLKHRTVRLQQEGQITDRINKAVEQLGAEKTLKLPRDEGSSVERTAPNIEVRVGAILSLERIAQDSTALDGGRDHVRVMEILCAYLRENARAANLTPTELPFERKRPRIDLQLAATVIKRRSEAQQAIEAGQRYRLDLREVDFDGFDLSKGAFRGAQMWRCRFEGSDLSLADFSGAGLKECLLNHALVLGTRLHGVRLDRAVLNRPRIDYTVIDFNLDGANARGVSVMAADLTAVRHLGEGGMTIIGSKDTILSAELEMYRTFANRKGEARHLAVEKGDAEAIRQIDAELEGNPFTVWFKENSNHLSAGIAVEDHFKSLDLTGWPFDDTPPKPL